MVRSNPNAQKPSTCIFTGYAIANVKISFAFTGDPESSTTQITGPRITPPPTTRTFTKNSSHHTS